MSAAEFVPGSMCRRGHICVNDIIRVHQVSQSPISGRYQYYLKVLIGEMDLKAMPHGCVSAKHIERKKRYAKYYPQIQGNRKNEKQNPAYESALQHPQWLRIPM